MHVRVGLGCAGRKGEDVDIDDLESRQRPEQAGPRRARDANGALVGADASVDGKRDAVARHVQQLREHLLCGADEFLRYETKEEMSSPSSSSQNFNNKKHTPQSCWRA